MGLKSLMNHLKNRAAVPSVPPEKITGAQLEPAWIKAVPLVPSVPPRLNDTGKNMHIGQFGQAVNGPASPVPDVRKNLIKPDIATAPELPADPDAWRTLAQAYYAHHFACHVCIAAGRGTRYGLRCGAGAALWRVYDDDAINRHNPA